MVSISMDFQPFFCAMGFRFWYFNPFPHELLKVWEVPTEPSTSTLYHEGYFGGGMLIILGKSSSMAET